MAITCWKCKEVMNNKIVHKCKTVEQVLEARKERKAKGEGKSSSKT